MRVRWLVCILFAVSISACSETTRTAADLLRSGLTAMGGEEKIRGLTALDVQAVAIRNMLEQSERPEGPYIVENDQVGEWRDLAHNNWKKTAKRQVAMQPEFVCRGVLFFNNGSQSQHSKDLMKRTRFVAARSHASSGMGLIICAELESSNVAKIPG